MQTGQAEYAKRKALEIFDTWLDITGLVPRFTSYYYELCGIVEDAVEIGSMTALDVPYEVRDGELVKHDKGEDITNVIH